MSVLSATNSLRVSRGAFQELVLLERGDLRCAQLPADGRYRLKQTLNWSKLAIGVNQWCFIDV